ncbi:hypothetical protein IM774_01500 [Erysipelotrichaceae bacterium RD49]|nr:hypothetical protein [Erysipelotrichaceae bacterium RD49]
MNDKHINQLLATLQEGVNTLTSSEQYQNYLKTMARFPSYSARNCLLIFTQNPNATLVAGYKSWKRLFGRQVREGEKGIRILAPYSYTVEKTAGFNQIKETRIGYRSICVFDISQTEGPELPALPQPALLCGKCGFLQASIPILSKLTGFAIYPAVLSNGHMGECWFSQKQIFYSETLEEKHIFKTLIHECTHALLHDFSNDSQIDDFEHQLYLNADLREIEAESVSYVVCQALGLDSADYSFHYIANYKQNHAFLTESLQRIARTAQVILQALAPDLFCSYEPNNNKYPFNQQACLTSRQGSTPASSTRP